MCGIVGLQGAQEDGWLAAMNGRIAHRGPDGEGAFRDRDAQLALAIRRLAIIDLAGGAQPMTTADGRHTLVYNGEIYNAPELRRALEARGVAFGSDHSDTEVLLQLYALEGERCLERLNGMFAFAVYDRQRGTLFVARDHAGIKPLYYTQQAGRFAFASELKALLALPFVGREVDADSVGHYLTLQYVPGEQSILRGIRRLPAGHHLTYRIADRSLELRAWYRPRFAPVPGRSRGEWRDALREALGAAVRRWTLSDVPLACSLSGGLDSSAIVGLLASAGSPPETFSVGFRGRGEAAWDELPLARKVAERWGTRHHELVLDPEALLEDLPAMAWSLDEPYGGGLPSWLVFKQMSRRVKVGLTGTGGDELFGNYGKWREMERAGWWPLRRERIDAATFQREFAERYYYMSEAEKARHVVRPGASTPALLFRHFQDGGAAGARDGAAAVDFATQLPEEFLMMTDRFSMAHSLEARTPFLDRELIGLALSIPADERTRRDDLKGLLRETVADLLPPEVLRAGKRGFVIPLTLWLRDRLQAPVRRLLAPERLARQGLLRPEFFADVVLPHLEGRADHTQKVWAAFMFQLWHLTYLEEGARGAARLDLKALAQ